MYRREIKTTKAMNEKNVREMMTQMFAESTYTPNRLECGRNSYMRVKQVPTRMYDVTVDTFLGMQVVLVHGLSNNAWRIVFENGS